MAKKKVYCRKTDLVVIVICVLGAAGVVLVLAGSCTGCGSMWEAREAELLGHGYTQQEVDHMIEVERDALAQEIKDLKDAIIDVVPVPGPVKEPVKDITDYWVQMLLAAVGGGATPVILGKLRNSDKGKLLG